MKEFAGLDSRDMEHLVDTLDASLRIHSRSQFFLWAQGALQRFIAHETMLCVFGDIARMRFRFESLSCRVLGATEQQNADAMLNALLPRIVDDWLRSGCVPRLYCRSVSGQNERRQLLAEFSRRDLGHVMVHGPKEVQGEHGSFFVFLRVPNPPGARDAYLLELLMPYLHMALHRMLANENGVVVAKPSVGNVLSRRQLQVLLWVKNGKTNEEIGKILDVSPPTVKNHVQKILRKLDVSNRAQAVGKADALRLFSGGERTRSGDADLRR